MTPDQLAAYSARIGLALPQVADLATLRAIHAAHCAAIPFENIDVQTGVAPSLDPEAIFAKLVTGRRGGWCYEQNGLLGRVLAALGFRVERVCAGVVRPDTGLPAMGSHLALLVHLDQPWLVDAGFGSWIGAPLPLQPGVWPMAPWQASVLPTDDGTWQLAVDLGTHTMAYAFAPVSADEALLAQMCQWQARDPASIFVQNLVVQRRIGSTDITLRGRVLIETNQTGSIRTLIESADTLIATLRNRFGLDVPQLARVWPAIVARHAALFPDQAAPTT